MKNKERKTTEPRMDKCIMKVLGNPINFDKRPGSIEMEIRRLEDLNEVWESDGVYKLIEALRAGLKVWRDEMEIIIAEVRVAEAKRNLASLRHRQVISLPVKK